MKTLFISLLIVSTVACTHITKESLVNSTNADQQLTEIITSYQTYHESQSPFNKPETGKSNGKLPDLSPEKLLTDHQALTAIYQELMKVNKDALPQNKQIDVAVLQYKIKNDLDSFINNEHYMPLTAESGFHAHISFIPKRVSFKTEQDYIDYLDRLKAIPKYFKQQQKWMRKGMDAGITQPKVVLTGFEESIQAFIKDDITQSVYYSPFKTFPPHITKAVQAKLINEAKQIIKYKVMPSYQQYYDFFVDVYLPNSRTNIAATSLPNGKEYYANRVKHYSTLALTYDEIHQIGLNEVKRIRTEMEEIIEGVGFTGSFAEFVAFLRSDPQFYAKTPEELLKEAAYIAKKMDAKLPSLFKTLPRTPYGVIEVPANIAPKYTTGRYSGPSRDDQPGNYWVNTYRLDRRPLYVLEALTLHEAVPGHHLQNSIAREMENVPKFRTQTYISAFGEGWGLYSEYLGVEAGFYQNPYSKFGRLTYEMWRACRLVVDTGMHAKGWSRDKSMNYLASNTALSLHNVKTEIDRYISWPAQALSYKLGELTIKRLRNKAEATLGEKFDLREFHDRVLENGSMPLSMLEKVINQYIENEIKQNNTK